MIYFVLFGALFFLAFNTNIFKTKQITPATNILFWIASFALVLFVGLRVNTGYDFNSYRKIFETIKTQNIKEIINSGNILVVEPGYLFLNYLCKRLTYQQFVFLLACISIIPKLIYFYKYCEKKMVCLFLYYGMFLCTFDMGIMRQAIALSISMWAYRAFAEKENKKFILLTAFATLFHVSSILLLLFYVFKEKKYSNRFYFGTILIAFIISKLQFLHFIAGHIPIPFIQNKLWYYIYNANNSGESSILLSVLKRLVIFVFFIVVLDWDKISESSKSHEILYLNAFYISIITSLLLSEVSILAGRGTIVFQIAQIFIFPLIFDTKRHCYVKSNNFLYRLLCAAVVVIWAFYSLWSLLNTHDYIPYIHV